MKFRDGKNGTALPSANPLMIAAGLMLLSTGLAIKSLGLPFNMQPADPLIGLLMGIGLGLELLALVRTSNRSL